MFEGKEITFTYTSGNQIKGIVVACVKGIGITIVKKNKPEHILYCLRMKNAPNFHKGRGEITRTNKLFTNVRKQIISVELAVNKIPFNNIETDIPASFCAFNQ